MFWAILSRKNTLYKYGDKIKGKKKMFGLTGYYYPYYSNNNYSYNPYLSNYGYNPFRNYSFFGNSNMNNPYYEQGYISGRKQRILNIANQSSYTLYQTQTALQEVISSGELTASQKRTLSKYLKKVSNLQQQFQNLVSQSQTASAVQAVDTVNNQIEALQYVMNMLLAEIQEELAEYAASEAEEDPDDTVVDDEVVDAPEDPADPDETQNAEDDEEIDFNYEDPHYYQTTTAFKQEVKNICKTIDKKVTTFDLFGTNSDLENAIKLINEDNVLDVFNYWNKMYQNKYTDKYSTGLIEAIYSEYHFYNGGNSNIKDYILPALKGAVEAIEAKLTNDEKDLIDVCIGNIETELDAKWDTKEKTISKNINIIVNILMNHK